jgi:hypothetical protein
MKMYFVRLGGLVFCYLFGCSVGFAWDYEGHRLVNHLALASLPGNFPGFVQSADAQERIAFLAGEPDRWRNTHDLPLKHFNSPDHFIDVEDLAFYRLKPSTLSHFRYEFTSQLALVRAANPRNFPPINSTNDVDRTKALIGFLPWTVTEYYAKLKSAFSYLKTFEEAGTPEEIANARDNVIFFMGVMGHFVGDATQPLHTTRHFNGWVGRNPRGYTTNRTFHSWIDGGYFQKSGVFNFADLKKQLRPARLLWPGDPKVPHEDAFPEVMRFILEQHKQVVPLYELEKKGKLSGDGEIGLQGRAFLAGQIVTAAQKLGDFWYSAWQQAPPDTDLKSRLMERELNGRQSSTNSPGHNPPSVIQN